MVRILTRFGQYLFGSILLLAGIGYFLLLRYWRRFVQQQRSPPQPDRPVPSSLVAQITGLTEAEAAARHTPVDREALNQAEWRQFRRKLVRKHLLTFFNLDMVGAAIAMYVLGSRMSAFLSLLVLGLSFGLNVFQEVYTKRKLDRMVQALQPQATVIREGQVRSIPLEMIVPGDVVVVGIGDRILLNGKVVGDGQIKVDEATSAGGVTRQLKQADDLLHAGSICVEGQAVYRVTELDPLKAVRAQQLKASLLPRTPTPLQQFIERIFKILFVLVLVFNALLFMDWSLVQMGMIIGDGVLVRDIVSQIFAIAPTSLFLMIAVSYAVGLLRIADVGALVYRSETIESLAGTSVLCVSRSGTLTGQQATVQPIPAPGDYDQLSESRIRQILGDCLHSVSNRQPIRLALAENFPGEYRTAVEIAPFYSAFGWSGITFDHPNLRGTYILADENLLQPYLVKAPAADEAEAVVETTDETTYGNQSKWFSKLWRRSQPTQTASSQTRSDEDSAQSRSQSGPAEVSLVPEARSRSITAQGPPPVNQGASRSPEAHPAAGRSAFKQRWTERLSRWFTPESVKTKIETADAAVAEAGGLTLLFAYRPQIQPLHDTAGLPQLPADLIPLGRVSLSEQVRPEAVEVMQAFVKAGVKIKILSADAAHHVSTTIKQLGLSDQETVPVISAHDLPDPGSSALASTVQTHDFYARLSPQQQAGVVQELRSQGAYVAVLGNQVTDIPAMYQADLRITSSTGGQALVTLADIVLMENSLDVFPNVLYRGQQIVNGLLETFKLYLTHLASHLLLLIFVIGILSLPAPYSSTQASVISFFAITVPAILLPFWASIGRVTKPLMVRQLAHFALPAALTTALLAMSLFAWYVQTTGDLVYARIVTTHALVTAGLVRVIFVKPPTPAWVGGASLSGDWRPVWMTVGAAVIYILFVAIVAAVPTFQGWFDLNALQQPQDYLAVIIAVGLWAIVTHTLWRVLWRYDRWDKEFGDKG